MKLFIVLLAFSLQALATEPIAQAPTEPNQEVKEKIEDIQGSIAKPTTEQTAAVSKAAVRAKKLKKKK